MAVTTKTVTVEGLSETIDALEELTSATQANVMFCGLPGLGMLRGLVDALNTAQRDGYRLKVST